jgi:ssDNA-binding Zn-finger/Zn-ribbon topoisomerase 1/predicted RNA-binding protein YlxR (DUF448 family)
MNDQSQEVMEPGDQKMNDDLARKGVGDNRLVICDYCDTELELSDDEFSRGWYVCPECDQLSHLTETAANDHSVQEEQHTQVTCGHCQKIVTLSAREMRQGWFFCPECQGLGNLDDFVTCLHCGSELELTEEEWQQEWYRCPECDHVTELVAASGDDIETQEGKPAVKSPAPDFAGRMGDSDWVQLKTASGPEEAALEVAYLRANGVEAYTWQQGAGRAYGLTLGSLGASHVMVREGQEQLARAILEEEVEGSLDYDEADDSLSDASKAAMGLTAVALSPIGAGLAFGISQVLGRHGDDEDQEANRVDCIYCEATVELTDQEIEQGHYICPECQQLVLLSDYVVCPSCQTPLSVSKDEREQGWYRCPECDQVTQL